MYLLLYADKRPARESDLFAIAARTKQVRGAPSHAVVWKTESFEQNLRMNLEKFLSTRGAK
jgi:hypothetical protein